MAFKYKLSEAPEMNLARKMKAKIGDISFSKDGKTKFVVNSVDKETGQVGWEVIELPAFDKLNDDIDSLVGTAKGVYAKTKDDPSFREFYEEARLLRNKIRKHLRSNYPEEYKRMTMEGEIEEATGVNGDVIDLNPSNKTKLSNYVKLPHHLAAALLDVADEMMADEATTISSQPQIKQALALLKKAAEKAMTGEKEVEEVSTSSGVAAYNTPFAFKKTGKEGVKDNVYVKKFGYKLVPKDKNGNYVQKGSGLEVKNF